MRIPMAFEAKGHAEGLGVVYFFHLVNASVALNATHPSVYVNGMIEINVVRRLVDADPRYGWTIQDAIAIDVLIFGEGPVSVGVFSVIRCPYGFE